MIPSPSNHLNQVTPKQLEHVSITMASRFDFHWAWDFKVHRVTKHHISCIKHTLFNFEIYFINPTIKPFQWLDTSYTKSNQYRTLFFNDDSSFPLPLTLRFQSMIRGCRGQYDKVFFMQTWTMQSKSFPSLLCVKLRFWQSLE